jgi:Stress responsive A/B Barrel Domain
MLSSSVLACKPYALRSIVRTSRQQQRFAASFKPTISSSGGGDSQYRHIVMFRLKDPSVAPQVREALLKLPSQIPAIQTYEVGTDLLLPAGRNHPAGPNRLISWTATFASIQDYQLYDEHASHKEFLSFLKDHVEPGSRASIQYEIK